jgi:hypothetical protein
MDTTTQLYDFGTYSRFGDVKSLVTAYLKNPEQFDLDGLADEYRSSINVALVGLGAIGRSRIILRGDTFYSAYPVPENATALIEEALEEVSLDDFAQAFEK